MPKTAEIIAQALKEEGVRYAFGIPGGEVLELLEAFRKAGIKFILTKQELGAGFMADAAYQLTGKPGVLVATLGPGITNTTTAVAQALLDRSAVMVITGEVATSLKAVYTHQIIDQESLMRPIVKWTTDIASTGAYEQVRKGIAIAKMAMPGPVHFNVPTDVAGVEQAEGRRFVLQQVAAMPASRDLTQVLSWLKAAKKPLAFIGVGVQLDGAEAELRKFVEKWRVPVITTYKAKGVIAEDHALAIGATGLSPVVDKIHMAHVRAADLILTIGFDPVELRSDWMSPWDEKKRTVNIDLVPNNHHVFRSSIEYAGSVAGGLRALTAAGPVTAPRRWTDAELDKYRATIRDAIAFKPARGLGPYQVAFYATRCISTRHHRHHRHRLALHSDQPRVAGVRAAAASAVERSGLHGLCVAGGDCGQAHVPAAAGAGDDGRGGAGHGDRRNVVARRAQAAPRHGGVSRRYAVADQAQAGAHEASADRGVVTGSPDYTLLAKAYGGNGVIVNSVAELRKATQSALKSSCFTLIEARIDPAEYRKQM